MEYRKPQATPLIDAVAAIQSMKPGPLLDVPDPFIPLFSTTAYDADE